MIRRSSLSKRFLVFGGIAAVVLMAAIILGLTIGSAEVPLRDIFGMLSGKADISPTVRTIVMELRGPRVLLGLMVGANLALAGCGFQGIMRNPLADPYIVGTSAGASLGATLAIVLHLPTPVAWASPIPAFAFLGALGAMLLVYRLSAIGGSVPMETFLLAGVVVGSFAGAMVSFLMTLADRDLYSVITWLMGSLSQADSSMVILVLPYTAVGVIAMICLAPALNIISMGEESASSLGVDIEKLKISVIIVGSLITAASVAAAGIIGFLGLFIPHIVRMVTGPDHRILLPIAALVGASFLILTDLAARTLFAPRELPVGVLTALIGAPFFFWLLHRRRRQMQ
ncbi:iron ABC transporter permease [bacterium]|nr:iron ABC transporter permease [bacterium]